MAIDRQTAVRNVFHGVARPAIADVAPIVFDYPPDLVAIPYDPLAARATLAPRRINATLTYSHTPTYDALALLLRNNLTAAGVNLTLHPVPQQLLYAESGLLRTRSFDLALTTWASGVDPDNASLFRCDEMPPAGWNLASYCSAEMDRWQERALRNVDPAVRRDAYRHIERLVVADAPMIFLEWPRRANLIANRLRHFSPNPVIETWNAWQWELAEQ
jgi:peptide/nickel transport system substrate-binding protein